MHFYTFEKSNNKTTSFFDEEIGFVTIQDLFNKSIFNNTSLEKKIYLTNRDDVCRMDKVCNKIYYGELSYIEELIVANDIMNPFSIEENQYILYVDDIERVESMHTSDFVDEGTNKFKILNINNNKRSSNVELPPSVNPGLKQIDIDYDKRKITILNKFK